MSCSRSARGWRISRPARARSFANPRLTPDPAQCRRLRRRQARRAAAGRRRARRPRGAGRGARRAGRRRRPGPSQRDASSRRVEPRPSTRVTTPARQRAADRRAGARRGQSRRPARRSIVVCAAGGLPGELHKLWRAADSVGYHLEYGYSCMGYEIAGGLGAKLAAPDREVYRAGRRRQLPDDELGDRDRRGDGRQADDRRARQPRLRLHQPAAARYRRRRRSTICSSRDAPAVDFAAHAASLGAGAEKVDNLAGLEAALRPRANARNDTHVIVIDTDPARRHRRGRRVVGCRGDARRRARRRRRAARRGYERARRKQRIGA